MGGMLPLPIFCSAREGKPVSLSLMKSSLRAKQWQRSFQAELKLATVDNTTRHLPSHTSRRGTVRA